MITLENLKDALGQTIRILLVWAVRFISVGLEILKIFGAIAALMLLAKMFPDTARPIFRLLGDIIRILTPIIKGLLTSALIAGGLWLSIVVTQHFNESIKEKTGKKNGKRS